MIINKTCIVVLENQMLVASNSQDTFGHEDPLEEQGATVEIYAISYSHSDITNDTWQRNNEEEVLGDCEYDDILLATAPPCVESETTVIEDITDNIPPEPTSSDAMVVPTIQSTKLPIESELFAGKPETMNSREVESPTHKHEKQMKVITNRDKPIGNQRCQSVPRGGLNKVPPKVVRFSDLQIDPSERKVHCGDQSPRRSQSVTRGVSHSMASVKDNIKAVVNATDQKKKGSSDSSMKPARMHVDECQSKSSSESTMSPYDRLYSLAVKKQKETRHKMEAHIENAKNTTSDKDRAIPKQERSTSPMKTVRKDPSSDHGKGPNYGKCCSLYDRGMKQMQRLELRRLAAESCASPSHAKGMDSFHDASKFKIPSPVFRKVKSERLHATHDEREEMVKSGRSAEALRE